MRLSTNYFNLTISIIALYPIWLGVEIFNITILLPSLLVYILILVTTFFVLNYSSKNNFLARDLILSSLIFFSLDINFGFWLFFDKLFQSGKLNYLISIIFIFLLFLVIFIIVKNKEKNKYIFLLILISLLIFNFFTAIHYSLKAQNVSQTNYSELSFKRNTSEKRLIIFLDEMVGPAVIDNHNEIGKKVLKSFQETFEKNNFKIYPNAYSIYSNTVESIPNLLNFNFSKKNLTNKFSGENYSDRKSKWFIKENKFFDQNKLILANKSLGLDLCKNKNVLKCITFTSNKLDTNYIDGFEFKKKDFFFDKINKSNSIILKILWRISLEFNLFDEKSDFSYQKALFENNLNEIAKIIKNTDFNNYVFHIVVPHRPFGFELVSDNKCNFSRDRAIRENDYLNNREEYVGSYYYEVLCTNLYLKKFFKILKEKGLFEKLEILVTSDTGIGFETEGKPDLFFTHSVLFAIKSDKKNNLKNQQTFSSQFLFSKYYDKNLKMNQKQNYLYLPEKKEFINFNTLKELKEHN